jgi:arsenate reductase (glutaredoxin)
VALARDAGRAIFGMVPCPWAPGSPAPPEASPSSPRRSAIDVQIFGTKKCRDTRKALRFFKERRIRVHFVDLKEKPASPGELRRFVQKFGVDALVDREGRSFSDRGLGSSHRGEAWWLEALAEDPGLLRTPLVRHAMGLSVGADEAAWKDWVSGS